MGGTVENNAVAGAAININADGAGTSSAPVVVVGNALSVYARDVAFLCGKVCPGSLLNVAPGSYVDRQGETNPPATTFAWTECP